VGFSELVPLAIFNPAGGRAVRQRDQQIVERAGGAELEIKCLGR
jgi:hypothetical protein